MLHGCKKFLPRTDDSSAVKGSEKATKVVALFKDKDVLRD
jgi:hypothetical protein